MAGSTLLIVSGIFLLAGLVKGMVGLGLPTIAVGLLCLFMQPIEVQVIRSTSGSHRQLQEPLAAC
jgi:uncharacterized membrane protein YfcA